MNLVETVLPRIADDDDREQDCVRLTWEQRQKTRQKVVTQGGRELGIALPTGTTLQPGDVLHREDDLVIIVEGVPERVFVITPATRERACLCAHHLGNLHRPIGIVGNSILTPYEEAMEAQILRLGAPFSVEERVFTHAGVGAPTRHVH